MATTPQRAESYYADTPHGLVTDAGTFYRTTEAHLRAWAEPVFAEVPLETLLRRADVWLRSPRTATIWALPALLLAISPTWAALSAGAVFLTWSLLSPAYASGSVANAFKHAENVLFQGAAYAVVLSVLAGQGRMAAVVVGLIGFVVLRWGIVNLLTTHFVRWAQSTLYPLPAPDQVLRALVVRTALQRKLSLPELDRMERSIFEAHSGGKRNAQR